MWDYLAAHPWWALIYLLIICFTAMIVAVTFKPNEVTRVTSKSHSDDDKPK